MLVLGYFLITLQFETMFVLLDLCVINKFVVQIQQVADSFMIWGRHFHYELRVFNVHVLDCNCRLLAQRSRLSGSDFTSVSYLCND